jgi:hypothetical protein
MMPEPHEWTVTITFSTDDDRTRADALLFGAPDDLEGWGRAKRNPDDPELPAIGHELAASRALTDLAHHLLERASYRIEEWQGRSTSLAE